MADRLSPERRSWNMGQIKGRDTKPEVRVRSILHSLGLRFRLHQHGLPGRPDIVLARWKTVILVHGCFWHRHPGCRFAYTAKSRTTFWNSKFEETRKRDRRTTAALKKGGWRPVVVWECELRREPRLRERLKHLFSGSD